MDVKLANGIVITTAEPLGGSWMDGEEAVNERYRSYEDFALEGSTELGAMDWTEWIKLTTDIGGEG